MYLEFRSDKFGKAAKKQVKRTVRDIANNFCGVTILSLAALECNSLILKSPLILAAPISINPATIVPVVSVGIVSGIGVLMVKLGKRRKR
jgi:hypothetical protein